MPSITGIELGPDSCVLVCARSLEDAAEVSALHRIERAEWPQHDLAQTTMLRAIRRRKRLPRRANVIAWKLVEPAPVTAPHIRSLLEPVIASGFRVEKIMTPPEALAAVARTRPRVYGAAVAWLALNLHGTAIAIVRDGELLFSRTFEWIYTASALGTRAELLQRYSLVSHLAPELRRGIMAVRASHAAIVETVITCGDLPDLRSLTMPLIEELDLEVETLDSTEGLLSAATARNDRFSELAPALRLAVAAAISGTPLRRRGRRTLRPMLEPAAVAMIVGAVAWLGQRHWQTTEVTPVGERVAAATPAAVPQNPRPSTVPPPLRAMPPATSSSSQSPSVPVNVVKTVPQPTPVQRPLPPGGPRKPEKSAAESPAPKPGRPRITTTQPPTPLTEPVPALESVLIANDRRVAIVGGAIVSVGDSVGSRIVSQIERDLVVLTEPSGYEIRVRLRHEPSLY